MKFKLRICNALELANLYNAVSLVGSALGLRAHRTPSHRAHSEKIRILRSFEALSEDERAEIICAAITMRNALAGLGSAQVDVEAAEQSPSECDHEPC